MSRILKRIILLVTVTVISGIAITYKNYTPALTTENNPLLLNNNAVTMHDNAVSAIQTAEIAPTPILHAQSETVQSQTVHATALETTTKENCIASTATAQKCITPTATAQTVITKPAQAKKEEPALTPAKSAEQVVFNLGNKGGFNSLTQETTIPALTLQGTIPQWLDGALLATGPALFDLGKASVKYWFDGFAMLHNFTFKNGAVSYTNKFLQSLYYTECKKTGKLSKHVANEEPKSFFSRIANAFSTPATYDNGNLAIYKIGNAFIATTETTTPVEFNPITLETKGLYTFTDKLEGQFCTAQPRYDAQTKEQFNVMTHYASSSHYHIYKINTDGKRSVISSLPVSNPSYMRSFSLTKNYIILTEVPLTVNPLDLLFAPGSFIEAFTWNPAQKTKCTIINRTNGKIEKVMGLKPFYMFHHVNAFEKDGTIVMDIITHKDHAIIPSTLLNRLRQKETNFYPPSNLERFTLDLKANKVTSRVISTKTIEMPTIADGIAGLNDYTYVYGISSLQPNEFSNQLIKINIADGTHVIWQASNCYPSKPVFVAKPNTTGEDDGVILSVVYDSAAQNSFLLVLNAHTFQEQARALLPHHIPFGLHGTYFTSAQLPK